MTFQQAMAAASRELNARATITCVDAFVISNTPVMSFSVEEGGQVTLGSVTSSRYTLSLPNSGGEWLKNGSILGNRSLTGARVQLQIGVYHDSAWDWQNAGLFIVEKTSAPEFGTSIKLMGNDPIISLDRAYDDQLAYRSTTTLGDILTHIKSKGVTITGSLACNASAIVNFQPDWGEEPTIRDVLGYVLQMGGSFARCDRAGNITIAPANGSTTHAITTDKYTEFTDDERYFNFNRIKILPNGAKKDAAYVESYVTSAAESAANTLCLEGNPLFKTKTTTSYSALSTAEKAAGIKNRKYYVKIGNKYEVVAEPAEASITLYYKANKSYNTATLQTMADGLKTALTGMSFRAITFKWRGDPTVLMGDKVTLTDTRGVSVTTVILQQSLRYEGGFSSEISCPIDLTAVTPATLTSSGAWTPPYFGTGTIDGSVIMPNSLTGTQFADGSITNSQIKGGTITGTEIADSTIKNSHFQDGTISGSIFEDGTINASKIDNSTFTNGSISGSAIDTSTFTDGTISGTKIDTSTFVDGTISGSKIDASTFTNGQISGSKINASTFTNGQISGSKIDSSTLTNIPFAQIKDLVADTAIFREIVAGGDVYIDRLKVADGNITNLTVGNLMVKRPDGTLHRIYVDGSGDLKTEMVELLYQNLSSDALLKVSEWTVYKKETAPSSPYVGQLWVKPSTGIMQKCLTITPSVTWGDVKAGELHTSYIDAVEKGLNILTGGELNVLGGSVKIKSLDGVANVINMDNTGLTLSSTGQLKLQSTDSIIIGGRPFGVGGTNLLTGTDFEQGWSGWNGNMGDEFLADGSWERQYKGKNLRVTIPQNVSGRGVYRWYSGFEVGAQYTFSCYINADFSCYLSEGFGSSTTTISSGGGWKKESLTFTATSTSTHLSILGALNPSYAYFIFVDNVKLEKGTVSTDWSPSPQDTIDALTGIGTSIGELQTQIDGKIVAYWQTSDPSTGWTAQQKSDNTGDMWYDTDAKTNALKRWNGTGWDVVSDDSAVKAYKLAATAKDTADGKRRVFTVTPPTLPTPPYDIGDLWVQGNSGDIMRCQSAKILGDTASLSHWVKASKYTNDSALTNFVNDTYTPAISVKNRIWYQPGVPTSSAVNDIWYDTDANPVKIYRANAANVSAIVTSGNGWYDITSVALDQALKGLNSLGNGSYHFFQSSTRPKSAGESGGSQINIGDIWLYTGTSGTKYVNGATYRAVSTNPTTDSGWLAFVAGAVLTPHIALDANHLTLSGESDLTIANPLGGNAIVMNKDGIAIESGGTLTLNAANDIKIGTSSTPLVDVIADNINLSANNSIKLAVSGGANLIWKTSGDEGAAGRNIWSSSGQMHFAVESSYVLKGCKPTRIFGTTGGYALFYTLGLTNHPFVMGDKYTLSFYTHEVSSVSAQISDANATNAVIYFGTLTPKWTKQMMTSYGEIYISYFEVTGTVTGTQSSPVLYFSASAVDTRSRFYCVQLEKGTMATDWSPAPSDPASGVKTSYIDIATDHIDISTGGNITMGAGALMKLLAAVVQIDASDASNSYINFGNAFNVSKGADGNFALTINSPTDNAIMVNNKPVWHKGNILVQQNQPASGSGVLWMKPVSTSQVIYAATITSKSSSTYSGNGYKEYALANQSTDVMSAAGTYSFAIKFTLRHYGDGNYTVSQITITLTKGGKTLTLYTGTVTVGGWSSKVVTATGTTTETGFTSGTGTINCKIQPSGTIPYTVSDFLAHEVGTTVEATITGPGGGGSAQLCEVKYVP